jgi:glycosyltransferase involved in cell wall biosynthesis
VRVVVCTIVHHPADARIYHRQIRALLDAGHEVRYIAPVGVQDFETERAWPSLRLTPVPRACGRRRTGAILAARSALAEHASGADLMLIHDPELLLALPARRRRPPVIWDVHEDTAAALGTKPWLPRPLRPPVAVAVHTAERMAERYVHLILAEHGYVRRFAGPHPVVPNTTYVPEAPAAPDDGRRVVYVGHLSPDRGTAEMLELARLLRPHGVTVELIGPADARARAGGRPAALARVRAERPGHADAGRRAGRPVAAARRAELPALDAHQGSGVHGPRGAGGDHPAARGGQARPRARMRIRGAVRRSGSDGRRGA